MRIQSGMHGPVLIVPDGREDRLAMDDTVIETKIENGFMKVTLKTPHHEAHCSARVRES